MLSAFPTNRVKHVARKVENLKRHLFWDRGSKALHLLNTI